MSERTEAQFTDEYAKALEKASKSTFRPKTPSECIDGFVNGELTRDSAVAAIERLIRHSNDPDTTFGIMVGAAMVTGLTIGCVWFRIDPLLAVSIIGPSIVTVCITLIPRWFK